MRRIAVLGSLLVFATLLLAACGGDDDDDDDDDGGGGGGSTPTATATMVDGADDDSSAGSSGGGGDFGAYASDLCTALNDFLNTLPQQLNQQELAAGNFRSIAEPYAKLADELEEYHAELVQILQLTADAFEEGGLDAFGRLDEITSFPTPPDDVMLDFSRAGGDVPACRDLGFVDG